MMPAPINTTSGLLFPDWPFFVMMRIKQVGG
jgi:hypothetical protein